MTTLTLALARHLGASIPQIARNENAGQCYADIQNAVDQIERMINRPIPPRYCGPCPTTTDNEHCGTRDKKGELQRTALLAPRDATEITCPTCKTTHNIEEIGKQLWSEVGEWLLSPSEIRMVMDYFGEPIAESTFRRWRAKGQLKPRGERHGQPCYWPSDVRKLRNTRKAK